MTSRLRRPLAGWGCIVADTDGQRASTIHLCCEFRQVYQMPLVPLTLTCLAFLWGRGRVRRRIPQLPMLLSARGAAASGRARASVYACVAAASFIGMASAAAAPEGVLLFGREGDGYNKWWDW